jgi:hypothetical protein
MAILNRRTRRGVFEISSANGLVSLYALRRARGNRGRKPDPKLEALLAHRAQRLKEKQKMAKLANSANTKSQLTEAKPPSTGLKFQLATTEDKWPQTVVMVLLILAIVIVSLLMSQF